jgi:TetR/AcrR family transcriptional regulator, transcriptional repressor for nem operon
MNRSIQNPGTVGDVPRPREFDEASALDAAMRAFWRAGYEATSTQDLCAATGLNRSSIYNTFHSKRALFEQALDRYMSVRTDGLVELLDRPAPIREKLHEVLWQAVDPPADNPLGCLVVNSLVELAPRDTDIGAVLARDQSRRREALRTALESARRDGELPATADPLALANFVMATVSGMQVLARGGADQAALASVADTALTVV